MTTTTTTELQQLSDRAEITDLVALLGACLDDGSFDDMAELLAEDATVRTPGGQAEGRAAVIAQAGRTHPAGQSFHHVITNVLVAVDGDLATARRVGHLPDVAVGNAAEPLAHELDESSLTFADVTEQARADERDPGVAEADQVLEAGDDAGAIVDVDGRHVEGARALPQRDHRDARVAQVLEQAWLVLHVAEQDDGVAVAGLEDVGERDGFVGTAVGVTQDHVVAA